jgi:hypothetical protein
VYSYDEDDMVLDPSLAEHLSHFGIDMLKMQKVRSLSALDFFFFFFFVVLVFEFRALHLLGRCSTT